MLKRGKPLKKSLESEKDRKFRRPKLRAGQLLLKWLKNSERKKKFGQKKKRTEKMFSFVEITLSIIITLLKGRD